MTKRIAYLLTYDKDDFRDYSLIHNEITSLPEVENWFHYIKSSYILIVKEKSASELNNSILDILPNKRYLLIEVNLKNRNGWLPKKAWSWVKRQIQKTK